jgi:hypothetical protein
MNYENDLKIDDSALDLELLDQAMLFMRYAKHYAETRRILDEVKQALDVVKAETDSNIRKNPEKYGLEKVTDKAIEAIILTDANCKKANQKFLDAKFELDMASNATQAMQIRKESLENLVRLNGQQYFAGPSVPHDLTKLRQQKEKIVEAKISSKLMRRG